MLMLRQAKHEGLREAGGAMCGGLTTNSFTQSLSNGEGGGPALVFLAVCLVFRWGVVGYLHPLCQAGL